jgi:hypothetical protein
MVAEEIEQQKIISYSSTLGMAEVHLFLANYSTSIFQVWSIRLHPRPLIDLLLFSLCDSFCFSASAIRSLCTIFKIPSKKSPSNACDLDRLLGVLHSSLKSIPTGSFRERLRGLRSIF